MEPAVRHQCVWSLIKACVPDSELPEIRAILGDALIDMYTEIYNEVQIWEQIWQEVHDGKYQMPHFSLADPPAVKELLRSELQLLLLSLRQQASRLGRDGAKVMSQYNPRVVSYVLGTERQQISDSTACTTPTSRAGSSRSSSRLSSNSSIEDEIEALRHKLNITHIDEVVSHLRSLLIEECEVLKNDVQFLQESVELSYLKQKNSMEPTLTELKKERRLIKQDLETLNLKDEATCTDKPKPDGGHIPRRKMELISSANDSDSKKKESVSPVSPRTHFLQPKPPLSVAPCDKRPALLGKTRHAMFTQLPGSAPNPPELQELDLENSLIQPMQQITFASLTTIQSERKTAFGGSATCRPKDETLAQHFGAAPTSLIPTPPTGQQARNMGQRVGRHLAVRQTAQCHLTATAPHSLQ
ncbi:coiled-coil domain-containing protein 24 [Clarias gariepinus]